MPLVFWVTSSTAQLDGDALGGKASMNVLLDGCPFATWDGRLWLECEPMSTWSGWSFLNLASAGRHCGGNVAITVLDLVSVDPWRTCLCEVNACQPLSVR